MEEESSPYGCTARFAANYAPPLMFFNKSGKVYDKIVQLEPWELCLPKIG